MTPVDPGPVEGWRAMVLVVDAEMLPALVNPEGVLYTEWEPSSEDIQKIVCGGRLRILTQAFSDNIQPIQVDVLDPTEPTEES